MPHKLLLADDSVTIQRVIELTFADEDVQVVAVGDGKQAIDRLQAERPDIVLADVGMPERDGYEVATFIKSNPDLQHIPVLLLTGAFEPIDEGRARSAGCDGVLVKPFEPQMVINRVKDLLAGRKPAGLWAAAPAAQTPVRPPAEAAPQQPAAAATGGQAKSESLEDYFDRLDAAFSTLDGAPAQAPAPSAPAPAPAPALSTAPSAPSAPPAPSAPTPSANDPLGGWDPDLSPNAPVPPPRIAVSSFPATPAQSTGADADARSGQAQAPAPAAPAQGTAPAAPSAPSAPPAPSAPSAPPFPSLPEAFAALLAAEQGQPIAPSAVRTTASIPDAVVEDIVQRVVDRMSDTSMRKTILDVAERLVREEIEKIKAQ